ncbi:hypothetical protein D3C75_854770 [compost metagenome]
MNGDSQVNLGIFFGEFVDGRNDAAGGYRDMALADVQPLLMGHEPEELHGGLIILEGLPDAHYHNTGDTLLRSVQQLLGFDDLGHNLSGTQIPLQAAQSGGAEGAADPAANLGGDTHAVAVVMLHNNGFYGILVLQLKQELHRTVLGLVTVNFLEGDEFELGG